MKNTIKYAAIAMIVAAFLLICSVIMSGCNRQIVDVVREYDYAWILLPNGECVEGAVESWIDYTDGDQIQVKIGGVTYLTDTTRCVLANK